MVKVLQQIVVGHKDQICLPCLVLLSIVRAVVLSFSQLPEVLNLKRFPIRVFHHIETFVEFTRKILNLAALFIKNVPREPLFHVMSAKVISGSQAGAFRPIWSISELLLYLV
jgi:hypothetical protein